ncbi:MAG: signal peptide peptidase SppA [Gammaproteobacteria bacterium]
MKGVFSGFLHALDVGRRVIVNLLFILIVLFIASVLFVGGERHASIDDGIAVLFDPYGLIVEEYDATPLDRAIGRLTGSDIPQVLLRDLQAGLEFAAHDARVAAVVLDLGGLAPVSVSKLNELAPALIAARANGKHVLVYADSYDQSRYFLAAHADEIFLHPMGGVFIDGYAAYRVYMKEALDKLSIDWHVFKAGDFKSYGEPYERNDMSPQVREETAVWLGELWSFYRERVELARALDAGAIDVYLDGMVDGVRAARGNLAAYAEATRLVDARTDYDGFVARVTELVGSAPEDEGFRGLNWQAYLGSARQEHAQTLVGRDRIAVLIASGAIVEGDPGLQAVGSQRIAELMEQANDDARVKALVLRVDSPGGSAFASEEIRSEIQRFRDSGRPVVVSMSSVAASGGYWISMAADEVWASPASITGSIGVIAMFPTFPRAMERLGLNTDGVATTRLAGALRADRELGNDAAMLVQLLVDGIYGDFVELVADARELEEATVLELAGGRVYTGVGAHANGLVDELGGLDEAVAAAASRAGLAEYAVRVLEQEPDFQDKLMLALLESRVLTPFAERAARVNDRPLAKWISWVERELGWTVQFTDPKKAYLYCFCTAP